MKERTKMTELNIKENVTVGRYSLKSVEMMFYKQSVTAHTVRGWSASPVNGVTAFTGGAMSYNERQRAL